MYHIINIAVVDSLLMFDCVLQPRFEEFNPYINGFAQDCNIIMLAMEIPQFFFKPTK